MVQGSGYFPIYPGYWKVKNHSSPATERASRIAIPHQISHLQTTDTAFTMSYSSRCTTRTPPHLMPGLPLASSAPPSPWLRYHRRWLLLALLLGAWLLVRQPTRRGKPRGLISRSTRKSRCWRWSSWLACTFQELGRTWRVLKRWSSNWARTRASSTWSPEERFRAP